MGACLDGQPQALPGRAALQRGISSCWFLFARTRETAQAKKLLMKRPATLLREPIYYYNMGCYDALLGNAKSAHVQLLTSFKMDPSFRDIATKDPDLKAIQELL
jgi:hypothetical protein